MTNKKLIMLFTILTIAGSSVSAEEPAAVESIPDDPDACSELILRHYQKSDMTEAEAKLRRKEFTAKEKAVIKEKRMIEKVQNKKKKMQNKADAKRQKADEYEKKIQYRINKMEEKKKQLETLIDIDEQTTNPVETTPENI